ncbi:hypothetical protein AWENTII_006171 [Aspergillus wentii]
MLLKVIRGEDGADTLENMHVSNFHEMSLFLTDIVFPTEHEDGTIFVSYRPPEAVDNQDPLVKTLKVPLQPNTRGLAELDIEMHKSLTKGYDMGSAYNDWFSERFGYRVVLAYLGPHSRQVLGTFAPSKSSAHRKSSSSILSMRTLMALATMTLVLAVVGTPAVSGDAVFSIVATAGTLLVAVTLSIMNLQGWPSFLWRREEEEEALTFADTAPYLLASKTSLDNVSARLTGMEMDITKFRPNIVVSGAKTAFEEDFWAELTIGGDRVRLLLTANCIRCQSINIDYATGKKGTGEVGSVFKRLMKDRRVDKGARFSPVFGRYTFLDPSSDQVSIRVGDEVTLSRTISERTTYDWPGLAY